MTRLRPLGGGEEENYDTNFFMEYPNKGKSHLKIKFYATKVIILVNIFTFVISVSFQDGGHKQNDRLHPF